MRTTWRLLRKECSLKPFRAVCDHKEKNRKTCIPFACMTGSKTHINTHQEMIVTIGGG